ncbi:DNA endonuclease [Metabacillus malikii]|uniref:DNA endonuclease n=1 Tax=Metabacillus malikii TaxID=1504265 RepID=UPI0027D8CA51|nr:DNA endonuclease [Metabacillus malikii]
MLNNKEKGILLASIIGDGEITKIYKGSRRKNNSYREHFSPKQLEYRMWKCEQLSNYLYITNRSQTLRSKSLPLFTDLYPYFYDKDGLKHIPPKLLEHCTSIYFLIVLYLDDGSLILSKRINKRKKLIYLMPSIAFYLQCYRKDELEILQKFILQTFQYELKLNKRNDGYGYILKMTKTRDVYKFLNTVKKAMHHCRSMKYKFDWEYRFHIEKEKLQALYPDYHVIESNSTRFKNYTNEEITKLIALKQLAYTDDEIAKELGRSYWSIVYKIKELRKNGLL